MQQSSMFVRLQTYKNKQLTSNKTLKWRKSWHKTKEIRENQNETKAEYNHESESHCSLKF